MSQSVWGYWLIALGIGVITVMMLVQNYTTINQEDYYLLKEVTQAAMNDAIDFSHYRQHGELKIHREKFIENFIRRFSESVKGNKNYKLDFYDIYETPPKVSVKVSTKTSSFNVSGDTMDLDVTNSIDAILENNSTNTITKIFYSVPYSGCSAENQDALGYCTITNSPALNTTGIKNAIINELASKYNIYKTEDDLKIVSSKYIGMMSRDENHEDWQNREAQYQLTYGIAASDVEGRAGGIGLGCKSNGCQANEIVDVKLTVTNNNVLAWSGKFKCTGTYGYSGGCALKAGSNDCIPETDLTGLCSLGIKYELKFSY